MPQRTLSITYGAKTVGAGTDIEIDGPVIIRRGHTVFEIEFQVVIVEVNVADFASEITEIELAFSQPRLNLTVTQEGTDLYAFSEVGNTGYSADPTIEKTDDLDGNSGRSRIYIIRVILQTPVTIAGNNGRLESVAELTLSASKIERIVISGAYKAIGGNNAHDQFDTAITAFITSTIAEAGGGNYEETSRTVSWDDNIKNATFQIILENVIFNQSVGVLDNAAIVSATMIVRVASTQNNTPAIGQKVRPDVIATVNYSASIDRTITTDLSAVWEDTIKPFILSYVTGLPGMSKGTIVIDEPEYHPYENSITASMSIQGGLAGILSFELTFKKEGLEGIVKLPVWSGNPFHKHVFIGSAELLMTITAVAKVKKGSFPALSNYHKFNTIGRLFFFNERNVHPKRYFPRDSLQDGPNWVKESDTEEILPKRVGAQAIPIIEYTRITTFSRADKVSSI